jgi:hypothetical protein
MAENQNSAQEKAKGQAAGEDRTTDARSDRDGGKDVTVGYQQDTGVQGDAATTSGGREGDFSQEDAKGDEGLDTKWSPGGNQPRT